MPHIAGPQDDSAQKTGKDHVTSIRTADPVCQGGERWSHPPTILSSSFPSNGPHCTEHHSCHLHRHSHSPSIWYHSPTVYLKKEKMYTEIERQKI